MNFEEIDIETGLKILSGLTALIALIVKVWENLSDNKRRNSIKTDLEIFELAKKHKDFETDNIQVSINSRISKLYLDTSSRIDNFRNFLIGMVLFLGFSWWSIDIYSESVDFNPKMILTGFMAAIGLALMFDRDRNKKKDFTEPYFVFEITKKSDFFTGLVFFIVFGLISWVILLKSTDISFWIVLTGAFALLGLGMIISEIKMRTKK